VKSRKSVAIFVLIRSFVAPPAATARARSLAYSNWRNHERPPWPSLKNKRLLLAAINGDREIRRATRAMVGTQSDTNLQMPQLTLF
jgi:hypothetical protein